MIIQIMMYIVVFDEFIFVVCTHTGELHSLLNRTRIAKSSRRARFRACGCRRLPDLHVVNNDEYPLCHCVSH